MHGRALSLNDSTSIVLNDNTELQNQSGNQLGEDVVELKGVVREIFQVWQIRRNLFIFSLIISICSFCYYSFNLSLKNVEGNLVHNTLSSQAAEVTANFVAALLYYKFGARFAMFFVFMISVVGAIGLIFVFDGQNTTLLTLFVGVAKFGISAAFNMIYICFMELIPTIFTATIFGYGNTAARIITILAP